MRKSEAKIGGKTYLMVLSLKTLIEADELGINLEKMKKKDGSEIGALDMLPIVAAMINSGAAYSKETGGPEYPPADMEKLSILIGLDEVNYLSKIIVSLFRVDQKIEAVNTKNAETTPTDQMS